MDNEKKRTMERQRKGGLAVRAGISITRQVRGS